MADVIFIIISVVFFVISWLYVRGCDRLEGGTMGLEYIIGLIVSVAVLLYLLYALLWPEKF